MLTGNVVVDVLDEVCEATLVVVLSLEVCVVTVLVEVEVVVWLCGAMTIKVVEAESPPGLPVTVMP